MTTAYLPSREVPRRPEASDGRDLRSTLRVLVAHWLLIVTAAVIGGASAIVMTLVPPRSYVAEAALLVAKNKIGEGAQSAETMSVASFRPLVESGQVAAQVIRDNHLESAPYFASPTNFFGNIVTIDELRNSTILIISGRLSDPQLVSRVVNDVARLGVETARRLSQDEAEQAQRDIKVQLDEAKGRLDAAEERLRVAQSASQLELLRRDLDADLSTRGRLLDLSIQIESERARLTASEKELANHRPADTTRKTIESDPAMLEAARASAPAGSVLGLQLKSEEVNPVYRDIDSAVSESRAQLAALEKERAQVVAHGLARPEFKKLSDYYAKDIQVSRLELERNLATKVYQDVATNYESARLIVAGRSSALHLISAAVPPDKPESRRTGRAAFVGLFTGLLLASIAVILRDTYSQDGGNVRGPGHP